MQDDTLPSDQETDPHGKSPHQSGSKLDSGKNRLGLLMKDFNQALWEVGLVTTYGAEKYTDSGWKDVPDAERRYMDAALRHIMMHLGGEDWDEESKCQHLAHAAWNILAVIQLPYEHQ